MMIEKIKAISKRIREGFSRRVVRYQNDRINRFLKSSRGVIHVGGNTGQECDLYAKYDLDVLWIEPIPEIFEKLEENIKAYPKQMAVRDLVVDRDDVEVELNIASNSGASSSIFPLKGHKELWPKIEFKGRIRLRSITLDTLIIRRKVNLARFDALVLDTQGAELLVIKGARSVLRGMKFVKAEASDFEVYQGGVVLEDLDRELSSLGFERIGLAKFMQKKRVGSCYNALYRAV